MLKVIVQHAAQLVAYLTGQKIALYQPQSDLSPVL